jgi:RecA-family ATPase
MISRSPEEVLADARWILNDRTYSNKERLDDIEDRAAELRGNKPAIDRLYNMGVGADLPASDVAKAITAGTTRKFNGNNGADHIEKGDSANPGAPPLNPIEWSDMSTWDDTKAPEPEYTVPGRIPKRQTTLFSGEGGAGKTTIGAHLCASHVLGKDWLGSLPEKGPTWIIEAEDEERVMRWRLERICEHFGVSFADLIKNGLRLLCLAGKEAVLGMCGKGNVIVGTPLYHNLLGHAKTEKPKQIFIASSANVFAGNELSRTEVGQFVNLLTAFGIAADGSTFLASHPSLQGINSGTGISGSTQWHNAVRARAYLASPNAKEGEQPDKNLREIRFMKNQYGRCDDKLVLYWDKGIFKPAPSQTSMEKVVTETKADEIFIKLLRRFNEQGQDVSATSGTNYAPAAFAKHPEAAGFGKFTLRDTMQRLLDAKIIHIETFGPPSKQRKRLVVS